MKHVQRKSKPSQSCDRTRVDKRVTRKSEEGTASVWRERRGCLKRNEQRECARFEKERTAR
eukprot:8088940-Pyramimonas_sp.AAC.1